MSDAADSTDQDDDTIRTLLRAYGQGFVAVGAMAAGEGPVAAFLGASAAGFALELLDVAIRPAITRRRVRFLAQLAEDVKLLKDKLGGLDPEKLGQNESFVSAFTQAAQIAGRCHQEEKLRFLRNAVLGSLSATPSDEDRHAVFIDLIDVLTPTHLRLLEVLGRAGAKAKRAEWDARSTAESVSLGDAISMEYPGLERDEEFLVQCLNSLGQRGLSKITSTNTLRINVELEMVRLTRTGRHFLNFVSRPIDPWSGEQKERDAPSTD